MILTERIITVNGNISTLDAPIYLYQGDKNVDIYFSIVNPKYKFSKKVVDNLLGETAAYFDLYIIKPDGSQVSFKNQAIEDKKAKWTIESELIDEEIEIGKYDFQIRLLDENKTSILTIPPLLGQLEILKPIYTDSDTPSNNLVNLAATNYALATSGNNDVVVFDEDGNYVATVWTDKMKITDTLLNKIETAIKQNTAQYKDIANKIENGIVSKIQSYPCGIIYLDGDTTGISKTNPVQLDILYVDEYGSTVFEGKSTTAWQGSGSLQYPNKNLSLKLKDVEGNKKKIKIFDYATSTYHLKCNYADYSMVRNSVGAQMVWDFDNTTFPVNAPITVKSKPVILYLNGEFNGCYTLNIKQDDDLFGMDSKKNPLTNIVYRSGLGNLVLSNFEYRSDGIETPEIQGKLTNLLNFINNSSDSDFKAHFEGHLNLQNAINYWIFADLACATDSMINNWTIATWDGSKWYMCWYDLDIIFGLFQNAGISYHPSKPTTDLLNCQYTKTNPVWNKLYSNYFNEISQRYWELRNNGTINVSKIVNQFRAFQSIWGTENITKERSKWSNRINKTDDIDSMYTWIKQRISYLDNKYKETVACTNITLNNTTLSFTTTDSQTLTATLAPTNTTDTVTWSVTPTGIVTVNKGVVTPIKDGNCTITATCGTKTATCNVTVSGVKEDKPCTNIVLNNNTLTFTDTTPQTITATLTPSDTTDEVIWSANPTGICTVENGVVTPTSNGQCTITATCGSQSATCNITVSGISNSFVSQGLIGHCDVEDYDFSTNKIVDKVNSSIVGTGSYIGTTLTKGGLDLTNSSATINFGDNFNFGTNDFTVIINVHGFSNATHIICGKRANQSASESGWSLKAMQTGATPPVFINGENEGNNPLSDMKYDRFMSIAMTRQGNSGKVYVNGELKYEGTNDRYPLTTDNTNDFIIGKIGEGVNYIYYSHEIYNRVLTSEELNKMYLYEADKNGNFTTSK